ncbi:MAG: NAD(P)-binding domain-containing protein [Burkholderiales bacterium]|nr:NAD(P)-binding domain-containing protein [Phycisphaerae bacterium]
MPILSDYVHWLHTRWPAGTVEKLPVVNEDGSTNVPGVYVVGDLTGIPLLKFSADTGARVVDTIAAIAKPTPQPAEGVLDLVIIGAGISGISAALQARTRGLRYKLLEASERFSTIVNFPKQKPIYTYPAGMKPAGELHFREEIHPKEALLEDLEKQANGIEIESGRATQIDRMGSELQVVLADKRTLRSQAVIVAIGRSGNFRKLGVAGEESGKVYNRLHDPMEFAGKRVLVVGGGDSALEAAIAIAQCGGEVTLSYRKPEFARPKPDNIEKLNRLAANPMAHAPIEKPASERETTAVGDYMGAYREPGKLKVEMASQVKEIRDDAVVLIDQNKSEQTLPNDAVFAMIGREPPLDFFHKSAVKVHGDRGAAWWIGLVLSLVIFTFIYHWKKGGVHILDVAPFTWLASIGNVWSDNQWFPFNLPDLWAGLGGAFADKTTLPGTMKISVGEPGFIYSLVYCIAIVTFGIRRIRRRKTPYVKAQTITLMLIQCVPLFLLPYIVLPWMGNLGAFNSGPLKWLADQLFPVVGYGHGREYWRAFGLILAWPLFIWNVFTDQPMWLWLAISLVQTFVIIPAIVYVWGKGAYCGWICSCGALAETVGDAHRTKMPHGPGWNRFNMVGQVFLAFAMLLAALRVLGWIFPGSSFARGYVYLLQDAPLFNYVWFVDLLWAGILGVAFYWHFSGRVWCRFACPLAALMHIYARFSSFGIIADKKKCISCNVCTSVCHQGIDVMNFANKGLTMQDPQCVRCSACVQMCPTNVLSFGRVDGAGKTIRKDRMPASLMQMHDLTINGRKRER